MFNKSSLKEIRTDIEKALKAVEKKHNMSFKTGNIRFSTNLFSMKLEAASSVDGKAPNIDKVTFETNAYKFGLKKTGFGKSFEFRGTTYKIVGLKPRARKRPIMAQSAADGKTYIMERSFLPNKFLAG